MHSLQRVRRTSRLARRNASIGNSKPIQSIEVDNKPMKNLENMVSGLLDKWNYQDKQMNDLFKELKTDINHMEDRLDKNIYNINGEIHKLKTSIDTPVEKPNLLKRILNWIKLNLFKIK